MSEHVLSYNERQSCKLAMAWYERINETVHSTQPVGETNYDEECLNSVNFYWQMADVMLQELMFAAEDAKKLDPRLQMYSVRKVHDECVKCLATIRNEIDDWLNENIKIIPSNSSTNIIKDPVVKRALADYTPEELCKELENGMKNVGLDWVSYKG